MIAQIFLESSYWLWWQDALPIPSVPWEQARHLCGSNLLRIEELSALRQGKIGTLIINNPTDPT